MVHNIKPVEYKHDRQLQKLNKRLKELEDTAEKLTGQITQ